MQMCDQLARPYTLGDSNALMENEYEVCNGKKQPHFHNLRNHWSRLWLYFQQQSNYIVCTYFRI